MSSRRTAAGVLDSPRLRTVLAVDAVATVLAGVLVYARPGVLGALTLGRPRLRPLREARTAGRVGLAVAAFGAGKGLLYGFALARYGFGGGGRRPTGGAGSEDRAPGAVRR
jgi:Na+/glutamate symporter